VGLLLGTAERRREGELDDGLTPADLDQILGTQVSSS
jgi:hypothetical protein